MASETESQVATGENSGGDDSGDGGDGASTTPDDSFGGVTPDAARRLLLGAVEAFAERGFHATTTRDIAGRAGMSPAALYIHYKTKEELLYQISRVGHERSVRILTEAARTDGEGGDSAGDGEDAPVRLVRAVRSFVRWHAEHHTTARVVQYELSALNEEHYAEIVGLRRRSEELLRGILEDGEASGEFAIADIRGTTLAVMSLCIDVARWFSPQGRRTPEEIGALYADLVLRMVTAPAPR
ncbi:TetR family transcriptional regulator [Streptomyces sp. NPDC054796]